MRTRHPNIRRKIVKPTKGMSRLDRLVWLTIYAMDRQSRRKGISMVLNQKTRIRLLDQSWRQIERLRRFEKAIRAYDRSESRRMEDLIDGQDKTSVP